MHLPPLSVVSAVWGVAELGLALATRAKAGATSRDRGSLFLIWIVCGLSVWVALRFARRWHAWDLLAGHAVYATGYGLFTAGVILRCASIAYLGRFFTPNVTIFKEHRLVDTGPYRFIRHPTYTGALVAMLGVTLTIGNLAALLVICVPVGAAVVWRMRIEEAALLEAFGDQYRRYMNRTWRLIPLIY
jgi:protein-S-isoprenylcysteine O-methyltransferase